MNRPVTTMMAVGLVLFLVYLWREGNLAGFLASLRGSTPAPDPADVQGSVITSPKAAAGSPLERLRQFAVRYGLTITSEAGGRHNPGSLHYAGRAIDVRSRGLTEEFVAHLRKAAADLGIRLRDERTRPAGQGVWGGPHLHLDIPYPNEAVRRTIQ
jgi:hypothetical protein